MACQIRYESPFGDSEHFKSAKENPGVYLFDMYCNILGGGHHTTMVHLFDYPYEEDDAAVKEVFSDFGEVKSLRQQSYVAKPNIYTGTRLVSFVLSGDLPRFVSVDGYTCCIWYRGKPLVCYLGP